MSFKQVQRFVLEKKRSERSVLGLGALEIIFNGLYSFVLISIQLDAPPDTVLC